MAVFSLQLHYHQPTQKLDDKTRTCLKLGLESFSDTEQQARQRSSLSQTTFLHIPRPFVKSVVPTWHLFRNGAIRFYLVKSIEITLKICFYLLYLNFCSRFPWYTIPEGHSHGIQETKLLAMPNGGAERCQLPCRSLRYFSDARCTRNGNFPWKASCMKCLLDSFGTMQAHLIFHGAGAGIQKNCELPSISLQISHLRFSASDRNAKTPHASNIFEP